MRKIFYSLFFFFIYKVAFTQQKLTYSFAENPQTLLLNPGAETNYQYHYGIPLFSGFNISFGSTGVTLEDLFLDNGTSFRGNLDKALENSKPEDYINFNARIDVLYGGYRLDNKTYLSFGFYEEVDITAYIPKDIAQLFLLGNNNSLNRPFSISQLVAKADVLGVFHFGFSKKVNSKLNIGARAKIYSSSFNLETNHNSGTFTTFQNDTNIIRQTLNNVDALIKTSGLIENNNVIDNPSSLLSKTFLGGNYGIGFDFGLTYHLSPQLEFTGSILDFGFIRHSKNTKQYSAKGSYTFDGIDFEYDPNNPRDYWDELQDDFDDKVPTSENEEAYTSWRPLKINAAIKYSFGETRKKACFTDTYKRYHFNAIGLQIHTVMRPLKPQLALTGFFETAFTEKIQSKVTYTINDFSSMIVGSGMSLQFGKVNMFGFVDNIFKVKDFGSSNTISVNFGINFVIE